MNARNRAKHKRQWHAKVIGAMVRTADRAKRGLGPTKADEAILDEDRKAADFSPCVLAGWTPKIVKSNTRRLGYTWRLSAGDLARNM